MKKPPRPARRAEGVPSRAEIKRFIDAAPGRVGKREISQHFNLGPEHRVALRGILKSLAHEGNVAPAGHRRFTAPGRLPVREDHRAVAAPRSGEASCIVVRRSRDRRQDQRPPERAAARRHEAREVIQRRGPTRP